MGSRLGVGRGLVGDRADRTWGGPREPEGDGDVEGLISESEGNAGCRDQRHENGKRSASWSGLRISGDDGESGHEDQTQPSILLREIRMVGLLRGAAGKGTLRKAHGSEGRSRSRRSPVFSRAHFSSLPHPAGLGPSLSHSLLCDSSSPCPHINQKTWSKNVKFKDAFPRGSSYVHLKTLFKNSLPGPVQEAVPVAQGLS